ncbi:hypothetical protein IEC_05419 [Bacillus toyonensis]|uniref:CPBP family intramembrane glutamic endopeptidase n=1 Tax=Bacillus toyonensis TaxID=155322 RepID=UPI000278BED3|nr:CPBP family intramembrane glutamic endopeptidase [Bacillus toyonensis]EJQ32407.1 hypothetical protein IEC_05419 [Bacillus toyonensis]KAB2357063.1 CPBP family intramembrane metalloprotease [Bacillus toyonensis]MCG3797089.1 CPBP family intramembrane metalloprotease [Bacillus toyonensis]
MSYDGRHLWFVLKWCLFIMLSYVLLGLMLRGERFLEWGLSKPGRIDYLFILSFFLGALIIFKTARRCFARHFIKQRKVYLIIGWAIALGLTLQTLLSLCRGFVYWLTGSLIAVGSNQYVSVEHFSFIGERVVVFLLSPFAEELFFRYVTYTAFFWILNMIKEEFVAFRRVYDGSEEKKKKFIIVWGLVSSFLFALFHGVNVINVWFYLIPGIVYSFLFVKYGFLASWISHSVFNATSSSVRKAVVYLFGL